MQYEEPAAMGISIFLVKNLSMVESLAKTVHCATGT